MIGIKIFWYCIMIVKWFLLKMKVIVVRWVKCEKMWIIGLRMFNILGLLEFWFFNRIWDLMGGL